MRTDKAGLALVLLSAAAVVACHDAGDAHGGDPEDLELWPIPNAGETAPVTVARPRDAGMDAGTGRDASAGTRDAAAARDAANSMDSAPPPPDLSLQVFDPAQVYLFGTLSEGACGAGAAAPVLDPNRASIGFGCSALVNTAQVRPSDGRLLYGVVSDSPRGVRVFSCDGCVADAGSLDFRVEAAANDALLASPCAPDAGPPPGTLGYAFQVRPDGGVLQQCGSSWVDEQGHAIAPLTPTVFAFGHAETALRPDGVLDLATGQVRPIVGLSAPRVSASRVREDGYLMVVPVADAGTQAELWHVDFEGMAKQLGVFPPLPSNQTSALQFKLDAQGRLFELTRDTTTSFRDTIVRRDVDGGSEVVYDEIAKPRVKQHGSSLFTGP